ncbi:HAD domain-containing protein [Hydrogenophaga sp.]|uniref:HAD domain-containing protein n=1 Tax=Hydrogenophaga sp. TaxID=1904254 RepID=UPI0027168A42|nr:HAD domain-containing protein [Hydrogenophaga sp.]MDO8903228.1 HAD domain-containing protein [Hydrogenophaga sp.]
MKAAEGKGDVVLYLDYDGVLHHEDVWWHPRRGAYIRTPGYALFEHMPLLEAALEPFPDVRIVLSTSWVRVRRFSRSVKRLSPALRERVIGATFHTRMNEKAFTDLPRGVQILGDVSRRQPRHWVALDDDAEGWPEAYRSDLIHTDEVLGISAPGTIQELRKRLAAFAACSS